MSALIAVKNVLGGWRALAFAVAMAVCACIAALMSHQRYAARTALAQHLAADALAMEKARADALERTHRDTVRLAGIQQAFEEERNARQSEVDRLLDDARTGAVRLRERFTCPHVPATTASPGPVDDGAQRGLREQDAEFLVRFAEQCDAVTAERNLGKQYAETVMGGHDD